MDNKNEKILQSILEKIDLLKNLQENNLKDFDVKTDTEITVILSAINGSLEGIFMGYGILK